MKRFEFIFKGRVQGVGLRYRAKILADNLNLSGDIKNLSNGDVICNLQGSIEDIDKFLEKLKSQRFIRIDKIVRIEKNILKNEKEFRIKY